MTKVLGPRTRGPYEVRLAYTGAVRVVAAADLLAEGVDLAAPVAIERKDFLHFLRVGTGD